MLYQAPPEKNNCKKHPNAKLVELQNCPVEFVYIFPVDLSDKRRWMGGIIRLKEVLADMNYIIIQSSVA